MALQTSPSDLNEERVPDKETDRHCGEDESHPYPGLAPRCRPAFSAKEVPGRKDSEDYGESGEEERYAGDVAAEQVSTP